MHQVLENLFSPAQKFDDKAVYELIGRGENLGCFQIESGLLQSYSKKLKPENIHHLADLISLVRPGTLEAIDAESGDNMAVVYCKRKAGTLPVSYPHPSLEPILNKTYGVLVYQEQAMEIAKQLAGFNLQEADDLRKAAGKKKPEEMAKIKVKFLEGTKKVGIVNDEEAALIFGWIEKSQRYSFNASHAMAYAMLTYASAWLKVNERRKFYVSWLRHARDKSNPFEEIRNLVNDAKVNGFETTTPVLFLKNKQFESYNMGGTGVISFGLGDIRGIGESAFEKLRLTIEDFEAIIGKKACDWNWNEFALNALLKIGYGTIKSLVYSGALDYMRVPRQRMIYEYANYKEFLTDNDIKFLLTAPNNLSIINRLKCISETTKINNRKILKNRN